MRRSTGRSPWSRKTRRAPPEGTPVNERRAGSSRPTGPVVAGANGRRAGPYPRAPSLAPLGQFTLSRPTGPAVSGTNGRMISAPTEWAVTRRLRGAPRPFGGRHRRRPGGPGRYSAAAVRACRVVDAGRPRRGSACHETKKGTGRGCTPGSCFVCTAFRRHEPPYWGVQGGRSPPALLSPPFLREEMGAPAAQASAGRLGLHQTGGYYPPLRAWQLAYRAGQARTLADGGPGRTPQMGRPPRRHRGTPHPPQ